MKPLNPELQRVAELLNLEAEDSDEWGRVFELCSNLLVVIQEHEARIEAMESSSQVVEICYDDMNAAALASSSDDDDDFPVNPAHGPEVVDAVQRGMEQLAEALRKSKQVDPEILNKPFDSAAQIRARQAAQLAQPDEETLETVYYFKEMDDYLRMVVNDNYVEVTEPTDRQHATKFQTVPNVLVQKNPGMLRYAYIVEVTTTERRV